MPTIVHGPHTFHLGYCMNVHATEEVGQVHDALEKFAAPLRAALCPDQDMGIGLRLSGPATNRLWFNRNDRARLKATLSKHRLLAFTANGFPIGNFHARRVKEEVFRPTWLEEARVNYTCQTADVLADLCGPLPRVTLSTVPGSFKPWGTGPEVLEGICRNLVRAAVHMHKLRDRTGKEVMVCLEPEPFGLFETTPEIVSFFQEWLFVKGRKQIGEHLGLAEPEAEATLKRHLGVCFDTCHQSVQYEDLPASLEACRAAGVPVGKLQLSCALEVPEPAARMEALRPFCEERWFHQVVARSGSGTLLRCVDLADLLSDPSPEWRACGEWRTHYHVPIHLAALGALRTTQPDLCRALAHVIAHGTTTHLEVETYTWDVIPAEHRQEAAGDSLLKCLERELRWVMERAR